MEKVFGVHFFIVQGHRDWDHDGDKWIGIYDDPITVKVRLEEERIRISREKRIEKSGGKRRGWEIDPGEIMVNAFDELSGKWTYDVDMDDPYTEVISGRLKQEEINRFLGSDV